MTFKAQEPDLNKTLKILIKNCSLRTNHSKPFTLGLIIIKKNQYFNISLQQKWFMCKKFTVKIHFNFTLEYRPQKFKWQVNILPIFKLKAKLFVHRIILSTDIINAHFLTLRMQLTTNVTGCVVGYMINTNFLRFQSSHVHTARLRRTLQCVSIGLSFGCMCSTRSHHPSTLDWA